VEPREAFDFSRIVWVFVVAVGLGVVGLLLRRARERLLQIGIEQAADQIERVLAVLNDPAPHDLAVISADAWAKDRLAAVEARLGDATALGFMPLGDVEDRSVSRATGTPSMMRGLVHGDGVTMLSAVARPDHTGALIVALECSSELSDDRFIETIATDAPLLDPGPQVLLEKLPSSTSLLDLLERHRTRVAGEAVGGVQALPVGDVDAAIQRAHRRLVVTATARAGLPGGISRDELLRLATDTDDGVVDRVHAELIRRQRTRSQTGSATHA
jgi:hypothetical protein